MRETTAAEFSAGETFGYFNEAAQQTPAYDPGPDVPCPVCGELFAAEDRRRTISFLVPGDYRCFFYRIHVEPCSFADDDLVRIESGVADARAAHNNGAESV